VRARAHVRKRER